MFVYHVIGVKDISYTKDNKLIEGLKLFLGFKDDDTVGYAVTDVFISAKQEKLYDFVGDLAVGTDIRLLYELNEYGKPRLSIIEKVTDNQ